MTALFAGQLKAAKPTGLDRMQLESEFYALKNPVWTAQEFLQDLGFYEGAIDGIRGPDLEKAIRSYQKKYGLQQTGKVSDDLLRHLENIGRVQMLLQRLGDVRKQKQEKARQALLANPTTRKLIENKKTEIADPTRDPATCYAHPTAVCLLDEAVASSHAVFEDDLRDWALGEILEAQVQVGLSDEAMETAGRIQDNRLVIAALTNIAKVQAKAGDTAEARSGLGLIPFMDRRLSVMLTIARHYHDVAAFDEMGSVLDEIVALSRSIQSPSVRLPVLIEVATMRSQLDRKAALGLLKEYVGIVRERLSGSARTTVLRQIATALADVGHAEWGLRTVEELPDDETRIPVLMASARAFLKRDRFEAARHAIERISAPRYRSIIMSDMGLALYQSGHEAEGHLELESAYTLARSIELPFAKNYALLKVLQVKKDIVLSKADKTQMRDVLEMSEKISDARMRAHFLWEVSAVLPTGDALAVVAQDQFRSAFEDIGSVFSKTWLLADLAAKHLAQEQTELAQKAFQLGMDTLQDLTNPWAKARALAKFGALAHQLD